MDPFNRFRNAQFYSSPFRSKYGEIENTRSSGRDNFSESNVPQVNDNENENNKEVDIVVGESSFQSSISASENAACISTAIDNVVNSDNNNVAFQRLLQQLPEDIRGVFEHCSQYSNTSFLFAMAYCFANNITELGSYYRVKLSLMLSLVQLNEDPKNRCSLLVLCDDDLAIGRLFNWAKQFAPKSFHYTSTLHTLAGVTSSVLEPSSSFIGAKWTAKRCVPVYEFAQSQMASQKVQQQTYSRNRLLVSGTLHLAAGGVHVFSTAAHLEALKSKERASLEHVLESNEIIPKELLANVDDITDSKLKSIIWANLPASNSSTCSGKNKSRWLDLFGSVVTVKSAALHCADFSSSDGAQISAGNWTAYFALCNSLSGQVVFSAAAESLIHRYYLFTRQYFTNIGGNSNALNDYNSLTSSVGSFHNQSSLATTSTASTTSTNRGLFNPKKCLSLLHLLASSVAKLNLRTEVLKEDALLAVFLFEMQLRDTAKATASAKTDNGSGSADDFSANFTLHQAAVRLPLAELDHIIEDDRDGTEEDGKEKKKKKEQDKSGRSVTMTAGSSLSEEREKQPKLNLSALLHNTYMASFERTLMDLFADQTTSVFDDYGEQEEEEDEDKSDNEDEEENEYEN